MKRDLTTGTAFAAWSSDFGGDQQDQVSSSEEDMDSFAGVLASTVARGFTATVVALARTRSIPLREVEAVVRVRPKSHHGVGDGDSLVMLSVRLATHADAHAAYRLVLDARHSGPFTRFIEHATVLLRLSIDTPVEVSAATSMAA